MALFSDKIVNWVIEETIYRLMYNKNSLVSVVVKILNPNVSKFIRPVIHACIFWETVNNYKNPENVHVENIHVQYTAFIQVG